MIERKRTTHETDISLKLRLKGAGRVDVTTGHGFFDHMLHQLAYHAGMDLNLKAIGDQTGDHHLVEDVAICLGDAFQEGWRNQNGLNRFGHTILPMDDALVMCATDLCGRAYCEVDLKLTRETVGGLDTEMVPHFFRSFSSASMINLHLKTLSGTNHHHVIEAAFKATARALRQALSQDMITFSTKGGSVIGIVDCGSGNIASVRLAFDRLGVPTDIRTLPDVSDLQALVLPGQGRFGTVMNALTERGWDDVLKGWIEADRKFLGICVGMQVLFEGSEEDPGVSGLGMLTGTVKRLRAPKNPMMGWARVCWRDSIFSDGSAFFVNGYAVAKSDVCCATTEYGEPFCCAVQRGHMFATQFHPEKSGKWGQEVLRQWINS